MYDGISCNIRDNFFSIPCRYTIREVQITRGRNVYLRRIVIVVKDRKVGLLDYPECFEAVPHDRSMNESHRVRKIDLSIQETVYLVFAIGWTLIPPPLSSLSSVSPLPPQSLFFLSHVSLSSLSLSSVFSLSFLSPSNFSLHPP